jgi:hypothetical protein
MGVAAPVSSRGRHFFAIAPREKSANFRFDIAGDS